MSGVVGKFIKETNWALVSLVATLALSAIGSFSMVTGDIRELKANVAATSSEVATIRNALIQRSLKIGELE
jgi:hypothetical protein